MEAMIVFVVKNAPSETDFNPMDPSNGALISVFEIDDLINSISALILFKLFKEIS